MDFSLIWDYGLLCWTKGRLGKLEWEEPALHGEPPPGISIHIFSNPINTLEHCFDHCGTLPGDLLTLSWTLMYHDIIMKVQISHL